MVRDLLIGDKTCGSQRLHNCFSELVGRGSFKDYAFGRPVQLLAKFLDQLK